MDLRMPVLDGAAATRRLRAAQPDCRVIVLTTFEEDAAIFDWLRAGATGYLLKDAPSEKLYEAIRAAARGESFLQPSVAARLLAEFTRLSEQAPARARPCPNRSARASWRFCACWPAAPPTVKSPPNCF